MRLHPGAWTTLERTITLSAPFRLKIWTRKTNPVRSGKILDYVAQAELVARLIGGHLVVRDKFADRLTPGGLFVCRQAQTRKTQIMKTSSLVRGPAVIAVTAALAFSLAACTPPNTGQGTDQAVYRIGIAQIVSHPSLDAIREGFKQCMADAGYVDGKNVAYDEQNPQGDQVALTSIANNFKTGNKDLVIAITTPVAQAMAQAMPNKPIVFAGVTDPVGANLVASFEAPGGNLTGTSDYPPIDDQIRLITEIKPSAKTIGIVYSSSEVNAGIQTQLATAAAAKLGLTVKTATVTNSSEVKQAAASLKGVDAFYVGNDNTVVSAVEALVQVAEQQKVPVIAADPDSVTRGATAAYAVNQTQMGCETAKIAVQVLKGTNPGSIPVVKMADLKAPDGTDPTKAPLQLTVNEAAAARQGVTIPQSVLDQAATRL